MRQIIYIFIANTITKSRTYAIHNYYPNFFGANLIHWQLALTDKVKKLIVSKTRVGATSKQVIVAIQTDTDTENLLIKQKDIYNKSTVQKQKQLGSYMLVQTLIMKLLKQAD